MKKLAISLLVLVLAALFAPPVQGAPRCITFTNFCDRVEFDTASNDEVAGVVLWGSWDWECSGSGTSVIGSGGQRLVVATRPVDAGSGYVFAYSTALYFRKSSHLFDLAATSGLSSGVLWLQISQGWTQTNGSCGFLRGENRKPRMLTAR